MARCLLLEVLGCMTIVYIIAFFITVGGLEMRFWIIIGGIFFFSHMIYFTFKRVGKRIEAYNKANKTGIGMAAIDWEMMMVILATVIMSWMHFPIFIWYSVVEIWHIVTFGKSEKSVAMGEVVHNPYAKPPPPVIPDFRGDKHVTTYRQKKEK